MSRGLGHVERAILTALEEKPARARSLAGHIYRTRVASVTPSQLRSVRRALLKLRSNGRVDCDDGERSQRQWRRTGPPDAVERETMRRAATKSRARKQARTSSLFDFVALEQWHELDAETRRALLHPEPDHVGKSGFTKQTGLDIEWAMWSLNVITGCLHDCPYCYAREIAASARMAQQYPFGFAPTLHPRRLLAPRLMKLPPDAALDTRYRNVFLGSMTDMFGRWVPRDWIEAAMVMTRDAPQWNFLCLTKFPKRMAEFDIPANAWMGTTVDLQARVAAAEAAFANVGAAVRWLSCEPLIEPLRFKRLDRFNWIVIGGASRTATTPDWRPPLAWINDLVQQARDAGLKVYFKTNLGIEQRILELPFEAPIAASATEAPAVFHYLQPRTSRRRDSLEG
jgi:protein gp37